MKLFIDQLKVSVTPLSKVINIGETVQFIATASGVNKNNFVYQWKKRDSDSLPDKVSGVNRTNLTIPNVHGSDEGQYYCIVTNEWDRSVESNDGSLTGILCKYSIATVFKGLKIL